MKKSKELKYRLTEDQAMCFAEWGKEIFDQIEDLFFRGLALFPLLRGVKRPAVNNWQRQAVNTFEHLREPFHGVYRSSGTRYRVRYNPNANELGVLLEDVFVLDIDRHNQEKDDCVESIKERLMRGYSLSRTFTVKTGGGGYHLYYRAASETAGNLSRVSNALWKEQWRQVDIKKKGGYVVAPVNNEYKVVEDYPIAIEDVDLLFSEFYKNPRPLIDLSNLSKEKLSQTIEINRNYAKRRLKYEQRGNRNNGLFCFAANLGKYPISEELITKDAYEAMESWTEQLSTVEIERTIESGIKAGRDSSSCPKAAGIEDL